MDRVRTATRGRATVHTRGERATLVDYLRLYRLTLELKCQDLTPEQLAHPVRPAVDAVAARAGPAPGRRRVQSWFRRVMDRDLELPRMWGKSERRDGDFDGAVGTQECVDEAFMLWRARSRTRSRWSRGREPGRTGLHGTGSDGLGGEIELREVLVHMIEEYARHCGHADLLRECIDGRTGQ